MNKTKIALRGLSPAFRSARRLIVCFALLGALVLDASATIYTWSAGSGSTAKKLRLNIPDPVGAGVVRGIIIHGNGADGDETTEAENTELVAFAKSINFAVLATGYWGKFDISGGVSSEFNTFVARIAAFATDASHPELVNAPWLCEGFSNGGQMAYGLNVLAPAKVIAFVANKGGYYNDPLPPAACLETPGLLIAGENDKPYRKTAIKNLFDNNRPRGAKWAWVEEENTSHQANNSYALIRPFLAECVKLRYPPSASPASGPVTLTNLGETSGWIVDQTTWTSGLTDVHAHDEETGDPLDFGWVPTQRIAYLYRAFSTYNKAAGATGGSSIVVNDALPATLTFNVNMTGQSWSKLEFYEGATKIGEAFPAGGNTPSINHTVSYGGYHVFHGVVTKTDTTQSATLLRPVFVAGPLPPDEAPVRILVDFGPSTTTTTGTDDIHTWNNLTSHALNAAITLVDAANAATGVTLTVTDGFTGNQSTGTTSPTVYVADATRDSFYYDNNKTPQLKLTGLDPATAYHFKFFGSRITSDSLVRSTRFTLQGTGAAVNVVNDATNNTGTTITANSILPTNAGEITIDLAKDTTNNTSTGVGYLGTLEITTGP
jgi:predicted esterase